MADVKQTQQGNKPQQETKMTQQLTEAQKAEAARKELIEKTAKEVAAKQAETPKGPDPKQVAAEALKAVEAKRAAEAAKQPSDGHAGGSQTSSGKVDRWPDRKKKSTIANPVQFVWDLADAMKAKDPTIRRKDVIQAAIDAGVAGYTARTQYQAWYQMQRESQRQAALQEAKRNEAQRATGTGGSR